MEQLYSSDPKVVLFRSREVGPELVALNRIPQISLSFATDFYSPVLEYCKSYRESECFNELLELFERQMKEPVRLEITS